MPITPIVSDPRPHLILQFKNANFPIMPKTKFPFDLKLSLQEPAKEYQIVTLALGSVNKNSVQYLSSSVC